MILHDAWDSGILSDLCSLRKETCNPIDCNLDIYVGLEHIESGKFFLKRHGLPKEVKSTKNRFYAGDVIYGKLRPYLDKAVVSESKGICSTDILVFMPKANVPPSFLAGILHCDKFIQHAVNTTHGVNHPRTSWKSLKDYEIKIPPLKEQQKIAAVFFKIQQAIEVQESINEAAQELKKSTMQHVFTYGLRGKKTNETEIGRIPESWEIKKFGEFATLHRGYDLPVQNRKEGKVPIVGSNGICGYHNKLKIKGPGVVTGRSGSIGMSYYINDDYWPLNTGLYVENFHNNDPLYSHYFFQSFNFKKYASGVSVPTLNRNLVHAAVIGVPLIKEQNDIVSVFKTIDDKIEIHSTIKSALQDIFKTILNKLMTGKIRVKDSDIDTSCVLEMKNKG